MTEHGALLFGYVLDGQGGGQPVTLKELANIPPDAGPVWLHFDRAAAKTKLWLRQKSNLPATVVSALIEEDVRPRLLLIGDAMLIVLRGVNLTSGADPEDMVGVRIWADSKRIITLRHRRVMTLNDIKDSIESGQGPLDTGEFISRVTSGLLDRIGPVVEKLEDDIDDLEDEVLQASGAEIREKLSDARRTAIRLRRYLAPQRDVVARLSTENVSWLDAQDRAALHESSERTIRYVEDIDSARERAAVTQDELDHRVSEQTNKTVYLLTVVATLLLPPSLIAGLLGINVGGIPGSDNPLAFGVVVVLIGVIIAVEYALLRKLKWI